MTGRVAEPTPPVHVEPMQCPICGSGTLAFREVATRAHVSGDRSSGGAENSVVLVSACGSCGPLGAAMITRS
jgi:hypothetical protein